jgi:hypothetical protein
VVKATRLTEDDVRRALTEDMAAVTAAQARAIFTELSPIAREGADHLRVAVQRHGVGALNQSELVIWVLVNIPHAETRARLLMEQYRVDEEAAHLQESVDEAASLAEGLRSSRALRTVLQTVLTARNVLSQEGCAGYTASSLDHISHERIARHVPSRVDPVTGEVMPVSQTWLEEHNPSMLALVSEMLLQTHVYRCRLRFLRMLAVGRVMPVDTLRCKIWAYLDDLHESPWDALTLLCECKPFLLDFDHFNQITYQTRNYEMVLRNDFPLLRAHASFRADSCFATQVGEVERRIERAIQIGYIGREKLSDTAIKICRLGGDHDVTGMASFSAAEAILQSMKLLGQRLRADMLRRDRRKRECAAADLRRARPKNAPTVKWATVDTRAHQLMATRDADLVRELRTKSGSDEDAPTAPRASMDTQGLRQEQETQKSDAEKDRETRHAAFYDTIHTGPEGVYHRDALTGKWGTRSDGVDGTHSAEINLGGPRPDL